MKRLALVLVLAWVAAACSSAGVQSVDKDVPDSTVPGEDVDAATVDAAADVPQPEDVTGKDADQPKDAGREGPAPTDADGDAQPDLVQDVKPIDTTPAPVTVGTYSDASTIPAGQPLQFECIVQGLADGTYATYLALSGPADVSVTNLNVTFYKVGEYKVACVVKWADGELKDDSPLEILVTAGTAAEVDTKLSENKVIAGDKVTVTCTIKDAYGNTVEKPAKVATQPEYGLTVTGLKILAEKVGEYQVACVEPESMVADPTPETLTVGWGLPRTILTELKDDTIVAGAFTEVSCKVLDAYDNEVPDFPVAVFLSPGLTINEKKITGTKSGLYQVACVPQNESWDLFKLDPKLLAIIAGPASGVSLTPVPDKPVYKMFETVKFIVSAVDQYGNVVDGVELLPVQIEPDDPGIIELGNLFYKFETEGVFVFSACLAANPSICGLAEITVDGYGPVITIKYPERGATIDGKPSVVVVGNVVDPVSGVKSFSINGDKVPLDPAGDFTYAISSVQGLNFIVAIAEDPNGFKTLVVQAYYYSPVWHKVDINDPEGSKIQDSLQFFLCDEFFDDYESDPDDLSAIAEMALATLDLGSFIPNPVASAGPYKVYVGPFSYSPPVIDMFPRPGGIQVLAHIYNLSIGVQANGSCKVLFIDFCPDVSGTLKMDEINLILGLDIWAENGQVKMNVSENKVFFYGLDVDIDGIIGFLFGWIVDWIADSYLPTLEQTANQMIKEQIEGLLGGFLEQLALNQQIEIPNPLDPNAPPVTLSLVSTLRELEFDQDGVEVRLDAAILAPKNITKNPLGSIGRASCLNWVPEKFVFTKWQEYALMAIFDDLVNEILFSAWWAGLLDLTIPVDQFLKPEDIEAFGFGSLEEFGIKDMTARTEFFLPPIITSCNDQEQLQMQVGDIYVELNMKLLNEPVTIGMFASLAAEANMGVTQGPDGSELSLGIGKIDPLVAQVTYISDNLKGAEGFMSMIVQGLILPALLDNLASTSLAAFPIPTFNISSLSNMLPPNIIWKFVIDSLYRDHGFTVLKAHIEAM